MGDLYDKIREELAFRKERAEQAGYGFEIPLVVPNVPKSKGRKEGNLFKCVRKNGRGERIRTSDPLVPNQVLYQAEPLPELAVGRTFTGRKAPG